MLMSGVSSLFLCGAVIFDQSLHGALLYDAQLHAQAFGCLFYLAAEGIGDRADAVDAKPRTAVLLDVAHEEVDKALDQQTVYLRYLTML